MPARSQVRLSTMATILGSLAGAVLLGIVVWQVREILLWIFISFFLAIVLNPLADRLTQHMRRPLAVLSIAALGLSLLAVALLLLLPPLVRQLVELARQGPELARATLSTPWVQWLDRHFDLFARLEREAAAIPGYLAGAATPALKVAGGLAHALLAGVTIFFMTLFMIWGGAPLAMQLLEPFEPSTRARVLRLSRPIYQATTRYALGVAVIASIAGLVTMVTLAIMGVPWFLPIGVAVGLLSFIPFIGATVGGLVSFVVTWTTVGFTRALIVLGVYLVYQQVENHLMQPLVHRKTVRLSPLAITVALLFGAKLAGLIGIVLSIPVAGAVTIIGRELLRYHRESRQMIAPPEAPARHPAEPPAPH